MNESKGKMFDRLTPDQQALATIMSDISERSYAAGWMQGLEYALWHLLSVGKESFGHFKLSAMDRHRLLTLSTRCGGWISYDMNEGEVFASLDDWKVTFDAYVVENPFSEK